jgi:hypothetical protein
MRVRRDDGEAELLLENGSPAENLAIYAGLAERRSRIA